MTFDASRYPANWPAIRAEIMARATGADGVARCEWCGAPDRVQIARHPDGRWIVQDDLENMNASIAEGEGWADPRVRHWSRVVLTTAHLGAPHADGTPGDKHEKRDCRPENLAALCNRCHLLYDLDDHIRHAAETRRHKRVMAGQTEMELVA